MPTHKENLPHDLVEKTQVIFFGLRTTNGGLLVKTWFFPLKSWKYLEKFWKIWKNELDLAGTSQGGVTKMGKNFFAFLDELDHLEAIKKY